MKCIALQQYCKSMMSLHCTGWRHFVGASTISFRPFSAFGHVSVSLSVLSVCLHWTSLDTLGIWPQGLDGRIIPRALRLLRSRCKLPSFVKPSNRVKPLFELVSLRVTTCHYVSLFEIRILVISKHEPNMLCKLFQNGPQHCKVIECDFKLQWSRDTSKV